MTARRGTRSPTTPPKASTATCASVHAAKRQADRGCAAAEVEHRERDGDRREVRTDVGDRARGEEQAEVAVAERLHERIVPLYGRLRTRRPSA